MLIRHDYKQSGTILLPVFKGSKAPTKEKLQRKIINYFIHHPELKPQNSEPWYCSKI